MFVSMRIVAGQKYRVLDMTTWSVLSFVSASELMLSFNENQMTFEKK